MSVWQKQRDCLLLRHFIPASVSLCANYQPAVIVSLFLFICGHILYSRKHTLTPSHSPDVCSAALRGSPDDTHGLSCFHSGTTSQTPCHFRDSGVYFWLEIGRARFMRCVSCSYGARHKSSDINMGDTVCFQLSDRNHLWCYGSGLPKTAATISPVFTVLVLYRAKSMDNVVLGNRMGPTCGQE